MGRRTFTYYPADDGTGPALRLYLAETDPGPRPGTTRVDLYLLDPEGAAPELPTLRLDVSTAEEAVALAAAKARLDQLLPGLTGVVEADSGT
jgi:hypothetical protein